MAVVNVPMVTVMGLRHCSHILWLFDSDGINNVHIINGNLLKASCNQCFLFYIQNLVEQHYQQIVKDFLLIHVLTSM